ncbi:hypothetical protein [Pseudomonas sp. UFMG81]|uniref:hypothetical protein n=1 Tax=Pseudomonas sp. UFMG81 TaxID=2745936 RepID=UPI00188FE3CE|nr:hypothetical protein [Pseudomonas sp. UFMG81]
MNKNDHPTIAEYSALANKAGYLTEDQIAMLAKVKPATLEDWRKRGNGPAYVRFGTSYLYSIENLTDHLNSLEKQRSREAIIRSI